MIGKCQCGDPRVPLPSGTSLDYCDVTKRKKLHLAGNEAKSDGPFRFQVIVSMSATTNPAKANRSNATVLLHASMMTQRIFPDQVLNRGDLGQI